MTRGGILLRENRPRQSTFQFLKDETLKPCGFYRRGFHACTPSP